MKPEIVTDPDGTVRATCRTSPKGQAIEARKRFADRLERYMQVAQDTKKEFVYSKSEGYWYWHDRGTETELSEPFTTYWNALCDAVSPYIFGVDQ